MKTTTDFSITTIVFMAFLIGLVIHSVLFIVNERIYAINQTLNDLYAKELKSAAENKVLKASLMDVIDANEHTINALEILNSQVAQLKANLTQFVSLQKYDCDKICLTGENCRKAFGAVCYDFNGVPDCLVYCRR